MRLKPGARQHGLGQCQLPDLPTELSRLREMRRWSRQLKLETLMRRKLMETGKQRLFHRRRSLIRVAGYRLPEVLDREASMQGPKLTLVQRSGRPMISDGP